MSEPAADKRKVKSIFVEGPILPERIAASIAAHQSRTGIGAHDIFLGQVRADVVDGRSVAAIEYSAYVPMAEEAMHRIREETFALWDLSCMHVYHSLGRVEAGAICLFVFVSAPHRQAAFDACRHVVEGIKAHLPVFGREVFEDQGHQWKTNR
ncbi:MAG: molybdenum cofactor biosynthesis protein MoaE [Flavobacteriales bacterium]|nr:Molybdopterin synthase catalytic subunit [Flavobacteriales bacterium]MCC6578523.1 molybdenum cofactor biosynthesis protein MoaE [Flavobacteriales bacterium]NUQ15035.1 molybdenum cofactor biosynthesis protein MoaE [Flavobacteriales bacterium]